ncbi:hypothetical protein, partial [Clostridium sp. AF32-12BH]|uniref:hypothetical protein n=1 Tax=Clostridium sp. AF32-12BH TaxID=2292006 RepID=UPI001A9ADB9E
NLLLHWNLLFQVSANRHHLLKQFSTVSIKGAKVPAAAMHGGCGNFRPSFVIVQYCLILRFGR